MNEKELINRLEDIEWEDFEVKEAKTKAPKSIWGTVSAFSNTAGDAPSRYNYRLPPEENIYNYYFSIFERIFKKIEIPFKLKGTFRDENQPQVGALREALVNLVMHTDYFSSAKPRVRVFLDRIEFFNPGSLPKDIEYILKEDFSMPRNPVIARIFRIIKLSETIGSGFHKMINGWETHYSIKPEISCDFDFYKIVFRFKDGGINGGINLLFEFIKNNPGKRTPHFENAMKTPGKTVEKWIKKLKSMGKIEFKGSKKTGGYYIKE